MTAEDFIDFKTEQWEKRDTVTTKIPLEIGEYKILWKREAFCFLSQSNFPEKVFVFERLRKEKFEGDVPNDAKGIGELEYRISYYISRNSEKWVFVRFCPLIPQEDFRKLLQKAKKENVLL